MGSKYRREDVKMNAKEAIEYLQKTTIIFSRQSGKSLWQEAHKMAISALEKVETLEAENARLREKETPKKPVDYKCPCCGESVFLETRAGWYQVEHHLKVCEKCGQKIDWSKLTFRDR